MLAPPPPPITVGEPVVDVPSSSMMSQDSS